MQIPKQPRTKPPAGSPSPPESQSPGGQSAGATAEDLNKRLQEVYSSYIRNVNSASLNAQLEYTKAYLTYLQALQQSPSDVAPALDLWREALTAHDPTQPVAETYKKFAQASIDQQANKQKTIADAANSYSQTTREIWEKLQNEIAQQNREVADSLKDALLKVDVGPANLPALSLLYQSLRIMAASPS